MAFPSSKLYDPMAVGNISVTAASVLIEDHQEMALLSLSHTPAENAIYRAMSSEVFNANSSLGAFDLDRLMAISNLRSQATLRRGIAGLIQKLSISRQVVAGSDPEISVYCVFSPREIFDRRIKANMDPFPRGISETVGGGPYGRAIVQVVENYSLSRREAQVAMCCVEGLSNCEIGEKLGINEHTVKFHMRSVFIKCGVRRRAQLVSVLLS
jgi:DNA-binding CsgD family transcriptional regulator